MNRIALAVALALCSLPLQAANYLRIPLHGMPGAPQPTGPSIPDERLLASIEDLSAGLTFPDRLFSAVASAKDIVLVNNGNATLTPTGIDHTGAFSLNYSGCLQPIAAGGTCTISAVYLGAVPGSFTDTVTISYDGTTSTSLSFNMAARLVAGKASFAALSFSGSLATVEEIKLLPVTNTGDGVLTLSTPTIAGNTTDFSLVTANLTPCGTSLAPGDSCNLAVKFKTATTAGGTRATATVQVPNNGYASTQSTTAAGSVSAATRVLTAETPTSYPTNPYLLPGFEAKGAAPSDSKTFLYTNTGNVPLTISSIWGITAGPLGTVPGNSNCVGQPLAVGASCQVTVYSANYLNSGITSFQLSYDGTSASSVSTYLKSGAEDGAITFGTGRQSSDHKEYTMVIKNSNQVTPIVFESIQLTDSNGIVSSSPISITANTCVGTVAPGVSCEVTFSTTGGVSNGTVNIRTNTPNGNNALLTYTTVKGAF